MCLLKAQTSRRVAQVFRYSDCVLSCILSSMKLNKRKREKKNELSVRMRKDSGKLEWRWEVDIT